MVTMEGVLAANVVVLAGLLRHIKRNGRVCDQHDELCRTVRRIAEDVAFIKGRLEERNHMRGDFKK